MVYADEHEFIIVNIISYQFYSVCRDAIDPIYKLNMHGYIFIYDPNVCVCPESKC